MLLSVQSRGKHSSTRISCIRGRKRRGKMNGYSRIRKVSTERSKSIDYSDLSFVPEKPNPIKNQPSKPHDNKENQSKNTDFHEPTETQGNQNEDTAGAGGEIFGVILSRKCTVVTSNSSNNFMSEKQSSPSVNNALKRTLSSIKRSTSVPDRYYRIHHQSDPPADDDTILMLNTFQKGSKKKKGKFFKACKRLLGF